MTTSLIYDIGMHQGEDTAFYLAKGYNVVAIEANPELVLHCKNRFDREIAQGRLQIIEGAIAPYNESGTVTFFKHPISVFGTINSDWNDRNLGSHETITVPIIDFAQCLNKYGKAIYIKIDIEGADDIILSSLAALNEPPRYISLESEKVSFERMLAELSVLRQLGYKHFKAVQQAAMGGKSIKTRDLYNWTEFEYTFENDASGPFGDELHGEWKSFEEIIEEYKEIFFLYKYFGDFSILRKAGRVDLIAEMESVIGRVLPGWYDTHAKL